MLTVSSQHSYGLCHGHNLLTSQMKCNEVNKIKRRPPLPKTIPQTERADSGNNTQEHAQNEQAQHETHLYSAI